MSNLKFAQWRSGFDRVLATMSYELLENGKIFVTAIVNGSVSRGLSDAITSDVTGLHYTGLQKTLTSVSIDNRLYEVENPRPLSHYGYID